MKIVQIKILDDRISGVFSFPKYATVGSAGLDLSACIDSPIVMVPNQTYLVSTGIAVYIADAGVAAMVLPRSGLGHKHGVILGNSVGLIDSDYQGEIMVSLWNRSTQEFVVIPGQRIAQLVFFPIVQVKFSVVSYFSPTSRGSCGFGHSM